MLGGLRMSIFRFIFILLLAVVGSSCRATPTATNSLAGDYVCDESSSSKIHLIIKLDGTYEASFEQPLGIRQESGVWTTKGEDLILQRRSGDSGFSIQRLRPDREVSGRLVWIFPAGSGGGGAIVYPFFHREV